MRIEWDRLKTELLAALQQRIEPAASTPNSPLSLSSSADSTKAFAGRSAPVAYNPTREILLSGNEWQLTKLIKTLEDMPLSSPITDAEKKQLTIFMAAFVQCNESDGLDILCNLPRVFTFPDGAAVENINPQVEKRLKMQAFLNTLSAEQQITPEEINQERKELLSPTSANHQIWLNLKKQLLSAISIYFGSNEEGAKDYVIAENLKKEILNISDNDLKSWDKKNALVLLFGTAVSITSGLKVELSKSTGLSCISLMRARSITEEQCREKAEELELPLAQMNVSCTMSGDWPQFIGSFRVAVKEYQKEGLGGAQGKFRAARLLEALKPFGRITGNLAATSAQQKELVLLACSVVFQSTSKKLKYEVLNRLGSEEKLKNLQLEQRIVPDGLLIKRRTSELTSSFLLPRNEGEYSNHYRLPQNSDELTDRRNKILAEVTHYQTLLDMSRKDKEIAENFQAALNAIEENKMHRDFSTQRRELLELIYLMMLTGPTELKDTIFAELGLLENDFKDEVNAIHNESFYGDFANLSERHAHTELVFTDDGSEKFHLATCEKLHVDTLFPDASIDTIIDNFKNAAEKYKAEHKKDAKPGDLGLARVLNLLAELDAIKRLANAEEKRKQLITTLCAIVFKSGSQDLKNEILKVMPKYQSETMKFPTWHDSVLPEVLLKSLQKYYKISNYEAWKKAQELNQLVKVPNWKEFRNQIMNAFVNYRRSGVGNLEQNLQAQKCIDLLRRIMYLEPNTHEVQYFMLLACTSVFNVSNMPNELKTAIEDFILESKIDKDGLKELQKQYGILHGFNYFYSTTKIADYPEPLLAVTPMPPLDPSTIDWKKLKEALLFAATMYLASGEGNDVGKLRARNLKAALEQIIDPTSDEGKKCLALLACTVTLHTPSMTNRLCNKVLVHIGMSELQMKVLQEEMKIENDACIAAKDKLELKYASGKTISFDSGVTDWAKFKADLEAAVRLAANSSQGDDAHGKMRNTKLLTLLTLIPNDADRTKRQLAVLGCMIALYLTDSTNLRGKVCKILAGASATEPEETAAQEPIPDGFRSLQIELNITRYECEAVITALDLRSARGVAQAFFASGEPTAIVCPLSCGWDELKTHLLGAANNLIADAVNSETTTTPTTIGKAEVAVAKKLRAALEKISNLTDSSQQKQLALLASTIVLATDPNTKEKEFEMLAGSIFTRTKYNENNFKLLRVFAGIKPTECLDELEKLKKALSPEEAATLNHEVELQRVSPRP